MMYSTLYCVPDSSTDEIGHISFLFYSWRAIYFCFNVTVPYLSAKVTQSELIHGIMGGGGGDTALWQVIHDFRICTQH